MCVPPHTPVLLPLLSPKTPAGIGPQSIKEQQWGKTWLASCAILHNSWAERKSSWLKSRKVSIFFQKIDTPPPAEGSEVWDYSTKIKEDKDRNQGHWGVRRPKEGDKLRTFHKEAAVARWPETTTAKSDNHKVAAAYVTFEPQEKTRLPQMLVPSKPTSAHPPTSMSLTFCCRKTSEILSPPHPQFRNPSQLPKWLVLSKREPAVEAELGWPVAPEASSEASRLWVRQNEGVWSPTGREGCFRVRVCGL